MDDFLAYLTAERHYSPHTVKAYIKDVSTFMDFIKSKYDLSTYEKVSHQMVREWMLHLSHNGYTAVSIRRMISSIRTLFRFLRREGVVQIDPMQKVSIPKAGTRIPEIVTEEAMIKVLEEGDFEDSFAGNRSFLMIELLYSTGVRVSELCSIRFTDIDYGGSTLKVMGKGRKQRLIPLSGEFLNHIKNWEEEVKRNFLGKEIDSYLFVTGQGKKVYPKLVYKVVKHYLSNVTTIKRKGPHTIRHSFATHLLDGGASLSAIKELLGHSDLSATQIYTHTSIEKILSIYKQAHPRATKRKE
ncbi:MAG TPA: hypothetical protein DCR43_02530 [Bacteroidales bacterium]|nr:MAG: hypothetical protein A2X11_07360 [Bacteroidetes bacterium GWE2_42_24]OFY29521.1 MAG: hypothetical protein A2X09_04240 [Bacteroidetes bacterium GWF2_43_11]PKP27639.1 MAG: hypothetical protein CVU06_01475 [Bacteroidetes bacterium HGW-Bacteroidetes-22]HAQ64725.1 hypothetical protein [Bacteroidales bacterium]HBZ67321.1 hypothetical protein [Bacteroidales bacterium]